jgi:3-methyladenine DNA glycosylase AlkD
MNERSMRMNGQAVVAPLRDAIFARLQEFGDVRKKVSGRSETPPRPHFRLTAKRRLRASHTTPNGFCPLQGEARFFALRETGATRSMNENKSAREDNELAGIPALAGEIDERLASLSNSSTAELRQVRREFSKRLKDAAPHVVIELGMLLLEARNISYRFVAYELVHFHPAALSHLSAWQLERFGSGISSWSAVDSFAVYLSGPVWRERRVPNALIHGWARSADVWWRRAALVSTVPLNNKTRGGSGDAYRTLQVCRLLERDRDPMVSKALSWALRELAKRDPRAVREYLSSRKSVLPALVLREVNNKLRTGLKNPNK